MREQSLTLERGCQAAWTAEQWSWSRSQPGVFGELTSVEPARVRIISACCQPCSLDVPAPPPAPLPVCLSASVSLCVCRSWVVSTWSVRGTVLGDTRDERSRMAKVKYTTRADQTDALGAYVCPRAQRKKLFLLTCGQGWGWFHREIELWWVS